MTNLPTNHQLIEYEGQPVAVVVPYADYVEMAAADNDITIPQEVMSLIYVGGLNSIQAWRKYKDISQGDIAAKLKITQPAYSQLEKRGYHTARKDTRMALCEVLELTHEHLDIKNEE